MTEVFPPITDERASETYSDSEESMTSPTKCVLLACGSFNPVTNMHLRMFGRYIIYFFVKLYINLDF